ncbi:FKBP-type peptidyl-prolyl cis-trans isomerase [Chloropicon primus]|uniref:peptidylprolyl isomerase n=1 Tax=Chloropicon primus TaxID=1764295 RepID=A0A5B8MM87_9CHLO|nr:FKBP-type peptidyl-prolyl cis-trans isomerase [Chloropicon primus]UPR00596.1 FKBP-type peptidyl-prolyl cis-trans isomerase [Chloropicon primus]|eukprot:QDZ21381.1 FKBP-type peptidyl-prolyl cis-trans isomerase [Chloropicon primus]
MEQVEVVVQSLGTDNVYPKTGQTVRVHYTCRLENGRVFDSTYARQKPFTFKLGAGAVVPGWEEAVKQGVQGLIPPHSKLYLELELLTILL